MNSSANLLRAVSFSPPDLSEMEIKEVIEVMRSGWITTGPRTKLLERRLASYIDTGDTSINCEAEQNIKRYSNRVICLNSATAAEELNLRILGIRPGDEVIVPTYTYTATASAVFHVGAKIVFIDSQSNSLEMDYDAVAQAINEHTKAIIPVDLGGIMCDYEKIQAIVEDKKTLFKPMENKSNDPLEKLSSQIQKALGRVAIVTDAAHALGSSYRGNMEGTCGDFTSFSFHAVKNFTTAEGGASTWKTLDGVDDSTIYDMYQLLSLHGQNKDALTKTNLGEWEYDIVGPWYKCNMTDIMAGIGLRQLDRYKKLLKRRAEIVSIYDKAMDELNVQHYQHYRNEKNSRGAMTSSKHLYQIHVPGINSKQRNEIIKRMAESGVSCNVHYKPLVLMTGYQRLGYKAEDFPNALSLFENEITLPVHTLMSNDDVKYVIEQFADILKCYRN